ncbi:MAG TPA: hypothetical protein VIB39_06310 [Candidatus Angelobacter sp.]|jgi:hypothetical protein
MQLWLQLALWIDEDSISDILGPIIVLAVFFAIIGGLVWYAYRRWRLRYGASHWPLAEATIQSEYACNPTSPGVAAAVGGAAARVVVSNTWNAVLQYSYYVADESYPGFFMLAGSFDSREGASTAARSWVLRKISVRYDPKRPWESAFRHADGAPPGSRSLGSQPPSSGDDVITLSLK